MNIPGMLGGWMSALSDPIIVLPVEHLRVRVQQVELEKRIIFIDSHLFFLKWS